jgi:hypothetical protein
MMTNKITIVALIAGIVIGAGAVVGFDAYRQSQNSQVFQERVHCKALADAYVKANSTDVNENPDAISGVSVTLDKVDYSPARNSCVAELETAFVAPRLAIVHESVQDLLSGETLFSAKCPKEGCEVGGVLKFTLADDAFHFVLNNASKPLALEKAETQMELEILPKSASPSGDKDKWDKYRIDPATGERVQEQKAVPSSKSPPISEPRSGR